MEPIETRSTPEYRTLWTKESSLLLRCPKTPKIHLKFIYSEKSTLLLTTVHTIKSKVEISQNFVAFSEYMNFKYLSNPTWTFRMFRILDFLQHLLSSKLKESFKNFYCSGQNSWNSDQNCHDNEQKNGTWKVLNCNFITISVPD